MNVRHVTISLGKELRETLRDRRTLAVMILFPLVVYPLLSLLAVQVASTRERDRQARPSQVAVVEGPAEQRQELLAALRKQPALFRLAAAGSDDDVAEGKLDALVRLRDSAAAAIVFDASRDDSRQAAERLAETLGSIRPEGCAPRFSLERRSLAARAQVGGYVLSKALPVLILLMVLLGAFYPAVDVTAGERERGTLETVLSSPIARFDLLLGKVLAVALLAAATGLVNLASMSVTLIHTLRIADPGLALPVPWPRAAAATLVILPTAFLFAAVFVAVGALARDFKQAQNVLAPVHLLAIAPAVAGTLGDYDLHGPAALAPIMNVTLLGRDLLVGRATWPGALVALVSTVVYGLAALVAAARIYGSERFVDPGPGTPAATRGPSGEPPARSPSAGQAMLLFGLAFILLYFVWLPLQRRDLVLGLLVADWAGMLGLVVLFASIVRIPSLELLRVRRAPAAAWLGAALIGATAWAGVAIISQWLNPAPKELLEQMRRLLVPSDGSRGLVATLGLVALTPAICEEALFRGPILRGLCSQLGPVTAVAMTGLLFGIFHLDFARVLPASLLGVLLSLIALRSGSILPAMLAHFLNNSILVVLAYYRLDQRLENVSGVWAVAALALSLAVTAAGVALLQSAKRTARM